MPLIFNMFVRPRIRNGLDDDENDNNDDDDDDVAARRLYVIETLS